MISITRRATSAGAAAAAFWLLVAPTGCGPLSGTRQPEATARGGVTGEALGALLADDDNRLLVTLLGSAVGASGGSLIGAHTAWFEDDRPDAAARVQEAVLDAERDPATSAEARVSVSVDIDQNGLVTLDELIAMEQASLSDAEIVLRLQTTDLVFDLTAEQTAALLDAGVSPEVVQQLETLNHRTRSRLLGGPHP